MGVKELDVEGIEVKKLDDEAEPGFDDERKGFKELDVEEIEVKGLDDEAVPELDDADELSSVVSWPIMIWPMCMTVLTSAVAYSGAVTPGRVRAQYAFQTTKYGEQ